MAYNYRLHCRQRESIWYFSESDLFTLKDLSLKHRDGMLRGSRKKNKNDKIPYENGGGIPLKKGFCFFKTKKWKKIKSNQSRVAFVPFFKTIQGLQHLFT